MAERIALQLFNDPQLQDLAAVANEYLNRFKLGGKGSWLTIMGNTGTGKTHVAKRLWKIMQKRANWTECSFYQDEIYWPEFVEGMRPPGDNREQFMEMMNWPVLFIDDMAAEKTDKEFSVDKLNMLLGSRIGKWTILTSNLGLADIEKLDRRIADRIIRDGNLFIEINTLSYAFRIQK